MTNPKTLPAWRVRLDATERAVRTFVAGMAGAVVVAIVPAVLILLGSIRFTKEWGVAALVTLGTVALNAISSYVARFVKTPNTDNPTSNPLQ